MVLDSAGDKAVCSTLPSAELLPSTDSASHSIFPLFADVAVPRTHALELIARERHLHPSPGSSRPTRPCC
jgi:hypothetical protein